MLRLNVGLSRKVGEPNYGSRGASVNLELEVESALAGEPHTLQDRIRALYRLARASVDEELNGPTHANGHHGNGQPGGNGHHHGPEHNGRRSTGRRATASQVRAIHAIAGQQRLDLTGELRNPFGAERPDDLSTREAAELIDAINPQTSGSGARR